MPQFKPAKIESRRGRIPVSDEARREARAGMGGEQTALAAGTTLAPVAAASVAPEPSLPTVEAQALQLAAPAPKPTARTRTAKAVAAPAPTAPEQEHSVKLSRAVVQQIKLSLALLPYSPENPSNIKQYLEMAHRVLDAQLRKAGKLPPTT